MSTDEISLLLRVTSVLSRGRAGGVIFAGLDESCDRHVAVCGYQVIRDPSLVTKGQSWRLAGMPFTRGEDVQIKVSQAELVRPSGANIISWIADSPLCAGIGRVKATKLYERFGPGLLDLIHKNQIERLKPVISETAAAALCHAFKQHRVAETLAWLDAMSIQRRIGHKLVAFFAEEARERIEDNPYRLTSFAEKWVVVDELARHRFGIALNDPRRFRAALDEALCSTLAAGHTSMPSHLLSSRLAILLGSSVLAKAAIELFGPAYAIGDGIFQGPGVHLIERYIAERLDAIAAGESHGQQSIIKVREGAATEISGCIMAFECEQGFELTFEQRLAVETSAGKRFSLILGGAGTGKTTVLKALYGALELMQPGVAIYQLALAGRAAQRMSEATGRESMTIAAFLAKVGADKLGHASVVVVDEVSMVDVMLMFRLLRHLPPGVRLVLVGDPSQLPPIGPGLVLHALAGHAAIPQTELKVTKRQSAATGIPAVAAAVRAHQVPDFPLYKGKGVGVSLLPCDSGDLEASVVRLYSELEGGKEFSVQVLSVTKNGPGGVRNLNVALHEKHQSLAEQVSYCDAEFGVVGARTLDKLPLRVGDLVMYTENDYKLGLRNGSLGVVRRAFLAQEVESVCCVCVFDGADFELRSAHVCALTHAYSITVHKSQGSQFDRVIIPVRSSRLLDQALVYTAITRGIEQVVLVGDVDAIRTAIAAPASAARRHVSLPAMLKRRQDFISLID